jgi:hypothetical protein
MRNFDEFIRSNIVKKQSIDRSRAEFLIKESENSYKNLLEMIQKIELSDTNANTFVKSCYDILSIQMGQILLKFSIQDLTKSY